MDRYERILTLHRILKSSRYPVPFDRLKDELRCSRATLYRDIAFLRDALGAPIDTDADNHAFGYAKDEAERFELPGLWLSSEELAALLALHQMLARTGPGVLSNALAPLRTRIERLLSNQESGKQYELGRIRVTGAATRRIDEAVFRAVASAVLERRQFAFRYRARTTGGDGMRLVSPQRLTHYRENWYLDAWDHDRKALRSFAVDRIAEPAPQPAAALDVPEADLDSHLAGSYGIFSGAPKAWATIVFSAARSALGRRRTLAFEAGGQAAGGRPLRAAPAVFERQGTAHGRDALRPRRRDRGAALAARGGQDPVAPGARRIRGARVNPAAAAPQPGGRSVSLVLGAGGARGLAHVGAIEVLVERGYRIELIAGSSMGALVGGIHAAGKLAAYRDWALTLQKLDVLKLVDWTLTGGGFIKGDRVIGALRELVGEVHIEALPIAYTAVATDLEREQEVWISRGPLFAAIQASISIPGLFRPQALGGRLLVDGGLLNPLPIAPALHAMTDMTIAVDVNGPVRRLPAAAIAPPAPLPPRRPATRNAWPPCSRA